MSTFKRILLFAFILLYISSINCKDTQTDSSVDQVNKETTVLPADTLPFAFILYDGLTAKATESIRTKLQENAQHMLSDFQIEQVDTYMVYLWGTNDSYLAAQQQHIGTRYPGSTGYVMGPFAMGLLNVSGVASNAVHEYAHSLSLRINGTFGNNPRWYWEAIALYESGGFVDPKNIRYLVEGNYPSLSELNSDFNTSNQKIYQVGYLLAEFVKVQWGMQSVIELIKQNGNIQKVLKITNAEFETQWKQFIETKYFSREKDSI
jgi:hypothetical protein